jgi:antitoxin (DNA-binding transcriptional repressor) of toxin-antitoxin stability system
MNSLTSIHMMRCISVFFLTVLLSHSVSAQKGTYVTKRITFQKGGNSIVIQGKARWGTSYIYLLRARAGQTLTVHLEGIPVVRIVPPGARHDEALEGADNVNDWSGKLPKTGDYQLNVGHANDAYADAQYTLKIKVE